MLVYWVRISLNYFEHIDVVVAVVVAVVVVVSLARNTVFGKDIINTLQSAPDAENALKLKLKLKLKSCLWHLQRANLKTTRAHDDPCERDSERE